MLELELMELIYQGLDPRTGKLLNTPREPTLDKRRAAYFQVLRRLAKPAKQLRPPKTQTSQEASAKPANQGARWSEAEDQRLREVWYCAEAPTLAQVAALFERNEGGIAARLVKLGIYEDREAARVMSGVSRNSPP
jgi:hypothetical protein